MKNQINLFEILGNEGGEGLVSYLKERDEKELKSLANQYSVKRSIKDKDEIIKSILGKIERTLNKGNVFDDNRTQTSLLHLYT